MTAKTYYLKDAGGFIEMRQTRFKRVDNHPHDVCAIARSKEELRGMLVSVKIDTDSVDWDSLPDKGV